MENEQRPLLDRPQGLLSSLRCSCPVILVCIVVTEILLISFLQYSGNLTVANRTSAPKGHRKDCSSPRFKLQTLKLIREVPFADIFGTDIIDKFENSDIIADPWGDVLYCVLDNSFSVARIGRALGDFFRDDMHLKNDALLRWKGDRPDGDSNFEFITFNSSSGMYIVGRESEEMNDGSFRSRTFDVTFDENRTVVHTSCVSDYTFSHQNKGFEGAVVVELHGRSLLLGLCEGNFCKGGREGRKNGNGRLIAMEREEGSNCRYRTVDTVNLPQEIDFQDYSSIAVWNGSKIGISSQENAAIFFGDLNPDTLQITQGAIYDFPRNDNCEVKYCTVEGLYFLERDVVVTVTDSMKGNARQPFRCREKDESMQVFQIPPT